ncbi:MAG: VWA domain-containing protein [Planctomycetota bacterium]|nr:MAG: VWA domain-containing protein [Planctomycetota bacterium]
MKRRSADSRRAAILTLFVFLLPVLVILLGFSIDLAYMQLIRTQMRAATDNAARAAAEDFAVTEDYGSARIAGKQMARKFTVGNSVLKLKNSDFEFGRAVATTSGSYVFDANGYPPNAVRVVAKRDEQSKSGPIPLFFGQWIGRENYQPTTTSVAAFLNVDICLVLDRSTSMKVDVDSSEQGLSIYDPRFCQPPGPNTRWLALESAVQVFVDVLNANAVDEYVAVVTYGSDLDDVYPGLCGREPEATLDLPLSSDVNAAFTEVQNRSGEVWNGNTVIASGIDLGTEELINGASARQYAEKVMIVLTDGHPTSGDAVAAAADAHDAGIRVFAVTFGDYANQSYMQQVADVGGGYHEHASDQQALEDVFRRFAAAATKIVE